METKPKRATRDKNIFVLGDDPFNEQHHLRPLSAKYGYNFHSLMAWQDSSADSHGVEETLAEARRRLRCFDGSIDGLLVFYDFPVSLLAPILCAEFELPSPSVEAVLKCEHKFWSRKLQQEVVPDFVPAFSHLGLDESPREAWDRLTGEAGLTAPFWIKPVKGVLGQLAFRVDSLDALRQAMQEADQKVDRFAKPLQVLLDQINIPLPNFLTKPHALRMFLAEEDVLVPLACTAEGYRFGGQTHLHGIVDSVRYPEHSAFHRYQYPSQLPGTVQARIADASKRVMEHIGFDGGAFNIEYFWDPQSDRLSLLEINPRISQSHSPQFQMVDGDANMKVIADLALGENPQVVHGEGRFAIAAKIMLRVFAKDAMVTRTPGDADIEAVCQRFPGTLIRPRVQLGQQLSEQQHTDSYSWEIAEIYMGADSEEELLSHYNEAVERLDFRLNGAQLELPSPEEVTLSS